MKPLSRHLINDFQIAHHHFHFVPHFAILDDIQVLAMCEGCWQWLGYSAFSNHYLVELGLKEEKTSVSSSQKKIVRFKNTKISLTEASSYIMKPQKEKDKFHWESKLVITWLKDSGPNICTSSCVIDDKRSSFPPSMLQQALRLWQPHWNHHRQIVWTKANARTYQHLLSNHSVVPSKLRRTK